MTPGMERRVNMDRPFFFLKVIFPAFAAPFLVFLFLFSFKTWITIHLDSGVSGKMAVYWSRDKNGFREEDSIRFKISEGKGVYRVSLGDLRKIRHLRLDPPDHPGRMRIERIEITHPGYKPIRINKKTQFQSFVPLNNIEEFKPTDTGLEIKTSGVDPHLSKKLLPESSLHTLAFYCFKLIGSVLMSCAAVAAFLLSIRYLLFHLGTTFNTERSRKPLPGKPFFITMAIIGTIRLIFVITYPFNIGGDGSTYYNMILDWKSSLVLAGGYPFVFGSVLQLFRSIVLVDLDPRIFEILLRILQHGTDMIVLMILYFPLKYVFGPSTAIGSLIFYGINPFVLGNLSVARPEWFQVDMFLVSLVMSFAAFRSSGNKKILFYAAAAGIFYLGFLSKFNLLPLGVFLGILLFFDRAPLLSKITIVLLGIACFGAVYMVYVLAYHKPSTGTRALTYDKSWILLRKARMFSSSPRLDIENGIHAKRYKVLSFFLSRHGWIDVDPPTLYSHVDAVSPENRAFFRKTYGYILSADEKTLDEIIRENPEIKDAYINQLMISRYIGLQESDELGTRVFVEAIQSEPFRYLKHVLLRFFSSFILFKPNNFPLDRNLGWSGMDSPKGIDLQSDEREPLGLGFSFFRLKESRLIRYIKTVLWKPGVYFFSTLSHPYFIWHPIAWIFGFLAVFFHSFKAVREKRIGQPDIALFFLFLIPMCFMLWSNMIYRFRPVKEFIFVVPFLSLFTVLAFIRLSGRIRFSSLRRGEPGK